MMPSILLSLPELYMSYKHWVGANPQTAGDVESTAKWISYFIAGRINNSNVASELVYCLSNLLVLFNDRIIHNTRNLSAAASGDNLKIWLTVLEYAEVFIEVTARKFWGSKGRWFIIVLVQLFKCAAKFMLLLYHKESMVRNPPVAPLKRSAVSGSDAENSEEVKVNIQSVAFTLKRSGRVIRRVSMAPPVHGRSWKPLQPPNNNEEDENSEDSLTQIQLFAEAVYLVKPLLHLTAMLLWGQKAWKPWTLALMTDLASLQLHRMNQKRQGQLARCQRLELSRRTVALLLYLLRSPFYERHTRDRLLPLLHSLAKNVPLVGLLLTPLSQYIPSWQDTYFYMWSC